MGGRWVRRYWRRSMAILTLSLGLAAALPAELRAQSNADTQALFRDCYVQHRGNDKAIGDCLAEGLAQPRQSDAGPKVHVPSVIGYLSSSALVRLTDAGLTPRLDPGQAIETSDPNKNGLVARTNPPGGREVSEGAVVFVVPYDYRRPTLDESFQMPNVVNRRIADAIGILRRHGLRPHIGNPVGGQPHRWGDQTGYVADQEPAAGTSVKRTDSVVLRPNSGPYGAVFLVGEYRTVPNVVGKTVEEAVRDLKAAELWARIGPNDSVPTTDERRHGRVAAQVPAASQVIAKGFAVNLIRYDKDTKAPVRIPKLRGMTAEAARDLLDSRGLALNLHTSAVVPTSDPAMVGRIASHHPRAESFVRPGSTVTAYRFQASDQAGDLVQVPLVTERKPEAAQSILVRSSLGYAYGPSPDSRYPPVLIHDPSQDGMIARQVPASGTWVAPNAVVNLHKYATVREVEMLDLRGWEWSAAAGWLAGNKLNFVREETSVPTTDRAMHERVAVTDPPPGYSLIAEDTGPEATVKVKVYSWTDPNRAIVVPDVIGMTEDQAEAKLRASGLRSQGFSNSFFAQQATDDRTRNGTVAKQEPGPGAVSRAGSRVFLTVYALAQYRPMPDLVGKKQVEAIRELADLQLPFEVSYMPTTDDDAVGTVARTVPEAGRKTPVGMRPPVLLEVYVKKRIRVDEPLGEVPTVQLTRPQDGQGQETGSPDIANVPEPAPSTPIGNPVVRPVRPAGNVYLDRLQVRLGQRDIYYASWTGSRDSDRRLNLSRNLAASLGGEEPAQVRLLFSERVENVSVRAGGVAFEVEKDGRGDRHRIVTDAATLLSASVDGWVTFEVSARDMQGRAIDANPASRAAESGPDKSHRVASLVADDLPYPVEPFRLERLFGLQDLVRFAPGPKWYTAHGADRHISSYHYPDKVFTTVGSSYVKPDKLISYLKNRVDIPCPKLKHRGCIVEDDWLQTVTKAAPGLGSLFNFRYNTYCVLCEVEVFVVVALFRAPPKALAQAIEKAATVLGYQPLESSADVAYWHRYKNRENKYEAVVGAVIGNAVVGLYFDDNTPWRIGDWTYDGTPRGYLEAVQFARRTAQEKGEPDPHPDAPAALSYEIVSRSIIDHIRERLPGLSGDGQPTASPAAATPTASPAATTPVETVIKKAERICLEAVQERDLDKKRDLIERCTKAREAAGL